MEVQSFELEFQGIDNATFIKDPEPYYKKVEVLMRDEGYIPIFDIAPQHRVWYDVDKEAFNITAILYGKYVGEDKAWEIQIEALHLTDRKYLPKDKQEQ